ncbi:protein of unknown function [Devosia lucknowensis]|uniref:DUF4287 domain-containing protein n=1 Tax=Devosia lucknowensis TaxID=1096929 RepID=A0A1Y6F1K0_9HYPH|nr:DUF4287 domain-containing protein [Devosia lucknowensis]SMQ66353.1 protein of unknown function [Devosia lucknowensis]
MSFQAYLDAVETKTGKTPREIVALAKAKGFDDPKVKAGQILDWLKAEFDLGRGHGMAMVHVIQKGPQIDARHVGTTGVHRDESDTLWLDGAATRPR